MSTALKENPKKADSKITYTSANADMSEFHRRFDEALSTIKKQYGSEHPLWINYKAVKSTLPPLVDTSPIDTSIVLGKFASATPEQVTEAIKAAKAAQKAWGRMSWQDRLKIMRKAASLIRERKYEIAAVMSVEVGKSRMEAMGDAEESADRKSVV